MVARRLRVRGGYGLVGLALVVLPLLRAGGGRAAPQAAPPSLGYTVTELAPPQGARYAAATRINNAGHVAGDAFFFPRTGGYHAVVWQNGAATDLGTLPGDSFSLASGINDADQIVGQSYIKGDAPTHAVLWAGGSATDLGTPVGDSTSDSLAFGINQQGDIVGASGRRRDSNASGHAVLWAGGTAMDLGTLPGGSDSTAYAINTAGQIVGRSATDSETIHSHAVLWADGQIVDLGVLPGDDESVAYAINDAGQIVGRSHGPGPRNANHDVDHAVLWAHGQMTALPTLGGDPRNSSVALALNAAGQIVGQAEDDTGKTQAVLWADGQVIDLNTLLPDAPDWLLGVANGINNAGQILGIGIYDSRGGISPFLLTPTASAGQGPPPPSVVSAAPSPGPAGGAAYDTSPHDGIHRWVVRLTDDRLSCARQISPTYNPSVRDGGALARYRHARSVALAPRLQPVAASSAKQPWIPTPTGLGRRRRRRRGTGSANSRSSALSDQSHGCRERYCVGRRRGSVTAVSSPRRFTFTV